MSASFTESVVEDAALAWLEGFGYAVKHGPDIACGEPGTERDDPNYRDVVLEWRLREALVRLNPELPVEAIDDAFKKLTLADASSPIERNRTVHRMLVDGVNVEYRRPDGSIAGAQAWVIDFEHPDKNDWLAVNQFTVCETQHTRRPDVVLFVNGLPLAVLELKNAAEENATVWTAFQQLQTYQAQLPTLFSYNAVLVASDGTQARIGVVGAGREWFKPWRTITGQQDAAGLTELQVILQGVFEKRRFLQLLRHFIVFEAHSDGGLTKKMAGYHQFHAVNIAVEETLRASRVPRAGRVPIYYESRLAKLELKESERPKIDPSFEEATEGEEVERKEKLKSKWAQLEAIVGSEKRLKLVARDLVDHFEKRLAAMDGKAMVVCMSRRICVELYREIVALRPQWQDEADDKGAIKVVMTGSASDPLEWQPHIRNKKRREDLADRFRDANDPFKIVIVRDMWLTGFDAPSLHTMSTSRCVATD